MVRGIAVWRTMRSRCSGTGAAANRNLLGLRLAVCSRPDWVREQVALAVDPLDWEVTEVIFAAVVIDAVEPSVAADKQYVRRVAVGVDPSTDAEDGADWDAEVERHSG